MVQERLQRRLAAVLMADVVGYSRLMARREVDTLARLKHLRLRVLDPLIAAYGGRLVEALAFGFAERPDHLPVLLRLSEFSGDTGVREFIAQGWGRELAAGNSTR
jgi:class 3 adenylate cyclase